MNISVLPVRRNLNFHLPAEKIDNWNSQGAHWTQFFNTLSVFFPAGERFFIQSVRNFKEEIVEPELKKAVSAFIGQEAFHTREHEDYNEAMAAAGIPMAEMEQTVDQILELVKAKLPNSIQLAVTVALEHLTAMLAELLLEDDRFIKGSDPRYTAVWKWHAMEETEHKGVCFDAYHAVVGTDDKTSAYALRCVAYVAANIIFWSLFYRYYVKVLNSRGELWNLKGWKTSLNNQFGKRGVFPTLIGEGMRFFKKGFHPWQHDNRHYLDQADELLATVDEFAKQLKLVS